MRRYNRYDRDNFTPILVLSGVGLLVAIITFVVIYFVYNNRVNSINLGAVNESPPSGIGASTVDLGNATTDASLEIGKTINEVLNTADTNETASTVSNDVSTNNNAVTNGVFDGNTTNTATTNTNTAPPAKVEVPDPVFKRPVEGNVILDYAKDNLVFSNTLQEWITHEGIDIASPLNAVVKASADGTVDSIKNDPRFGLTIIITHVNGYKTVYANLASANFVKKGDKVKSGQSIGTVGNTAAFEIEDEAHLHFEIMKNNANVNPNTYLK